MKIFIPRLLILLFLVCNYQRINTQAHKFIGPKIDFSVHKLDSDNNNHQQTSTINLIFKLAPEQQIYAQSIHVSINAPDITISKPVFNNLHTDYDHNLITRDFTISCIATHPKNLNSPVNLHVNFLLYNYKRIVEKNFSIFLGNQTQEIKSEQNNLNKIKEPINQPQINSPEKSKTFWMQFNRFSNLLQSTLTGSKSITLRLVLVFLLGLLMSFTPCIYPMIPITAGILQAQGSNSLGRSFILALTYTIGTSTTFAIFGLIAALTHHLFGQLLVNPIFITIIIIILIYLGLSMFGLYDMYMPKFMSQSNYTQKNGSLISVFIFGVISGSMASPCLSPGLALLLSIVATLGNNLLGFILLFVFGLGLSMPLLIVGTFSSSINMIPRSGNWMVEIKKLFGFMLLAMCIYLLHNILPTYTIAWIIVGFVFCSGVYYLQNASHQDGKNWYLIKNLLGCSLIIISIIMSTQAIYKTYFSQILTCDNYTWQTNYTEALTKAKDQNQKLLIDCGADWCSICKAIDKHIFEDNLVKEAMCNLVALKVDATDQYSEPYQSLKEKYCIKGVPTILIIDPNNGELLNRWGSDLYDLPKNEFIKQLEKAKLS